MSSNELMLEYRVVVQRVLKRADDHAEDDADDDSVSGVRFVRRPRRRVDGASATPTPEKAPTTITPAELRAIWRGRSGARPTAARAWATSGAPWKKPHGQADTRHFVM